MARRNYTLSIWKPIFIQNWSWELKLVDDFFFGYATQATLGFAERNAEGYGFVTEDGHESGKGPAEGSWEGGVWRGFGGFCVHVGTKDAYKFDFSWICWWMFFFFFAFFFLVIAFFFVTKNGVKRLPKTFADVPCLAVPKFVKFGWPESWSWRLTTEGLQVDPLFRSVTLFSNWMPTTWKGSDLFLYADSIKERKKDWVETKLY